jgi:hypothetical protein
MLGKRLLWLALAVGFLSNSGCCGFWDRMCHNEPRYAPQPCCAPAPPVCGCPTGYAPAAVPVPPAGPPRPY